MPAPVPAWGLNWKTMKLNWRGWLWLAWKGLMKRGTR